MFLAFRFAVDIFCRLEKQPPSAVINEIAAWAYAAFGHSKVEFPNPRCKAEDGMLEFVDAYGSPESISFQVHFQSQVVQFFIQGALDRTEDLYNDVLFREIDEFRASKVVAEDDEF